MKIFFISHSSVLVNYRDKLRLLSRQKGLELVLMLPHLWPEAGRKARSEDQGPEKEGFRILSVPVLFPGKVKRHFYPSFFPYVARFRPDIIHIEEEPYSFAAWQALQAARELGSKFVFFTWENLLERFPFPHQGIRDRVLREADHAIVGNQEAGRLLQKAGVPPGKISLIPQYGVDPGLFRKKDTTLLQKELRLGPRTIGYVGRLVADKGLRTLFEAFARSTQKGSTLLLVGNGPLRQELGHLAAKLGFADRVRWVPAVDQSRVADYLNCMDVLVLPSLTARTWKEQFGRVIIEAQACGVPVIGSDSGAIPEVIGKAGLIFPEGRSEGLTRALGMLLGSPALRRKLSILGRQQVLRLYTNQRIADRIQGIYQALLQ